MTEISTVGSMFPPESSATAWPSPPALPESSAATPTAPAPSTTSLARSSRSTIAWQISSSVTLIRASSVSSRIWPVRSPTDLTKIPSAIVQPSRPAWTPTIRTSGLTARSASEIPDERPPPPTGMTTVPASGTCSALAPRERLDLVDGAADLERAGALQVLGLERDVAPDELLERLGAVDRGDARDPVEPRPCLLDLSLRRCRLHLQP